MTVLENINLFGNSLEIFNIMYPIGYVYPQYPKQKSPNELWGDISTWEEIDYGGAFFRAAGGNSDTFDEEKEVTSVVGTALTIPNHNAKENSIIYDFEHNESRIITAVDDENNVTINLPFTSTNITFVLITQNQGTAVNGLSVDGGGHDHNVSTSSNQTFCLHAGGVWSLGSYGVAEINPDYTVYSTGSTTTQGEHTHDIFGDIETRPTDFTMKLWRRIN